MRNESIVFKGINRNSFDNGTETGYCEELINVRSDGGQMKIIPDKSVVKQIQYDDILEHITPSSRNYIGHKISNGYHVFQKFDLISGSTPVSITYNDILSTCDIYYTCVNNFFVISDKTNVKTYIFIFDAVAGYKRFYSGLENVSFSQNFDHTYLPSSTTALENEWTLKDFYQTSEEYLSSIADVKASKFLQDAVKDSLSGVMNKATYERPNYSEGYVITMMTITIWDNTEIPTGNFIVHKLDKLDDYTYWSNYAEEGISDYDRTMNLVRVRYKLEGSGSTNHVTGFLSYVDIKNYGGLDFYLDDIDLSQYKDIIKSVNLYCSAKVSRLDFDRPLVIDEQSSNFHLYFMHAQETAMKDGVLDKQLLYKQKSWNINELPTSTNKYHLDFGKNQVTENTLDVTSRTERAGKMFTYNKRIHFFDSRAKLNFRNSAISSQFEPGSSETCDVYAFLRIDGTIRVIKHTSVNIQTYVTTQQSALKMRKMLIYPDSRAYRLVFVNEDDECADVPLSSSKAYNYSYAYESVYEFWTSSSILSEIAQYSTRTNTIVYDEDTAVNVTSQGNPIFFPVQNSYSVDYPITNLAVAFEEISAVQTGQYPVYVFTENGIYALEQGSGDVLYASVVPVNSDKVSDVVKQTRYGIVYISNGRIMLLNGRQSKCLSDMIDGEPDMDIRGVNGSSFYQCCCSNQLYNISQWLSSYNQGVTFDYLRDFLSNAVINWSSSKDELVISSTTHLYSYVLNMSKNTWYKISKRFTKSTRINDLFIAYIPDDAQNKSLVDYSKETSVAQTFHIQTRPIMLSPNQYTTILRSILNVKANIESTSPNSDIVTAYIFGSDNNFDWYCVAGAQKRNCEIKGIRLNRSTKSYKYHVIIIGGKVKPTTEILNMVMTVNDVMNNKLR